MRWGVATFLSREVRGLSIRFADAFAKNPNCTPSDKPGSATDQHWDIRAISLLGFLANLNMKWETTKVTKITKAEAMVAIFALT